MEKEARRNREESGGELDEAQRDDVMDRLLMDGDDVANGEAGDGEEVDEKEANGEEMDGEEVRRDTVDDFDRQLV